MILKTLYDNVFHFCCICFPLLKPIYFVCITPGRCRDCWQGLYHVPCKQRCNTTLFCGHRCPSTCHAQCSPCQISEPHLCLHGRQEKVSCMPFEEKPRACKKKPLHRCSHANACEEANCLDCICRCNEPCKMRIKCFTKKNRSNRRKSMSTSKHACVGLCGEPCPSLCRICDKEQLERIARFAGVDLNNARFIQLPCNHIFEVEWLDHWMEERIREIYTTQELAFPECPNDSCNVQLRYIHRYNDVLAPLRRSMATAVTHVFGNLAMNQTQLFNLYRRVEENSSVKDAQKEKLLAKIRSSVNTASAYTAAYLDTLVKVSHSSVQLIVMNKA